MRMPSPSNLARTGNFAASASIPSSFCHAAAFITSLESMPCEVLGRERAAAGHVVQALQRESAVEAHQEQADLHGEPVVEEAVVDRRQRLAQRQGVKLAHLVERRLELPGLPQIELRRRYLPLERRQLCREGRVETDLPTAHTLPPACPLVSPHLPQPIPPPL